MRKTILILMLTLAVVACSKSGTSTHFGCESGTTYTCKDWNGHEDPRDYTFQVPPDILCKDRVCVPSGECSEGCYFHCPDDHFGFAKWCAEHHPED